jgi:hypothetical protein
MVGVNERDSGEDEGCIDLELFRSCDCDCDCEEEKLPPVPVDSRGRGRVDSRWAILPVNALIKDTVPSAHATASICPSDALNVSYKV